MWTTTDIIMDTYRTRRLLHSQLSFVLLNLLRAGLNCVLEHWYTKILVRELKLDAEVRAPTVAVTIECSKFDKFHLNSSDPHWMTQTLRGYKQTLSRVCVVSTYNGGATSLIFTGHSSVPSPSAFLMASCATYLDQRVSLFAHDELQEYKPEFLSDHWSKYRCDHPMSSIAWFSSKLSSRPSVISCKPVV